MNKAVPASREVFSESTSGCSLEYKYPVFVPAGKIIDYVKSVREKPAGCYSYALIRYLVPQHPVQFFSLYLLAQAMQQLLESHVTRMPIVNFF